MRTACVLLFSVLLSFNFNHSASAFSLIGPVSATSSNGPVDGAVNIGQGYRWNVPVVTYAYDQSFLNFFGANGVAAVESAMQILNALPPASSLNPNAYPTNAVSMLPPPSPPIGTNPVVSFNLIDLKSAALSLVLKEMGLASPEQSIFQLQSSISAGVTNYNVVIHNFDPITDAPSSNINGTSRGYTLITNSTTGAVVLAGVPVAQGNITAAGFSSFLGANSYFTQISYDDAGGLRYLLSPNNLALENLIPGVQGAGTNASNYVTTALRPGIDKITFQRVFVDAILGQIVPPLTNFYVDSYVSNSVLYQQNLQRVITHPDILFTAASFGANVNVGYSSTADWANNGSVGNSGPGVIQPPITITFNRIGLRLEDFYDSTLGYTVSILPPWGSFDVYTNGQFTSYSNVVTYPAGPAGNTAFNLQFYRAPAFEGPLSQYSWNLPVPVGSPCVLQYSSDLVSWSNIVTFTNLGAGVTCLEYLSSVPQRYFRTIPAPQ